MLGVTIRSVAAGNKHSLAISSSGQLFTWGRGADGQCGHGDQVRRCQPTLVRRLADIPIAAAAAGGYHSICAAADGSVYTFGSGARGRIGHGDEADRHVPKLVEALRECSVVAVSAGYKHSLALTDSGAASWGKGSSSLVFGSSENAIVTQAPLARGTEASAPSLSERAPP